MVDARAETPESEPDENMLVDNDIDQSPRSDHDGPDAMRSVPSSPVLLSDADAATVLPSEDVAEIDAACRTGPGRLRAHASIPPMHPAAVLGKMAIWKPQKVYNNGIYLVYTRHMTIYSIYLVYTRYIPVI
jgi:hypothetical protein